VATRKPYFGTTTIVRFGNRIAKEIFSLDAKHFQLAKNSALGGIPCQFSVK
jgi:galactose mutarotase-like enzyme